MNVVLWVLFGIGTGIIIALFERSLTQEDAGRSVVLGIVGALFGGVVGNMIFGGALTSIDYPLFIAVAGGSIALLFIGRMLSKG